MKNKKLLTYILMPVFVLCLNINSFSQLGDSITAKYFIKGEVLSSLCNLRVPNVKLVLKDYDKDFNQNDWITYSDAQGFFSFTLKTKMLNDNIDIFAYDTDSVKNMNFFQDTVFHLNIIPANFVTVDGEGWMQTFVYPQTVLLYMGTSGNPPCPPALKNKNQ